MNSSIINTKILTKWSDDHQNDQLQNSLELETYRMAEEIFDFDYDITQLMNSQKESFEAIRTSKPLNISKNKIKPMRIRKDRSMPATGVHLNILHEEKDEEIIKTEQLSEEVFEKCLK